VKTLNALILLHAFLWEKHAQGSQYSHTIRWKANLGPSAKFNWSLTEPSRAMTYLMVKKQDTFDFNFLCTIILAITLEKFMPTCVHRRRGLDELAQLFN
jgi:hypothetical protein